MIYTCCIRWIVSNKLYNPDNKKGVCNKMYFFTFALQSLLHAETTKALEIVLSQDTLVVFPFLGALK